LTKQPRRFSTDIDIVTQVERKELETNCKQSVKLANSQNLNWMKEEATIQVFQKLIMP